MNIKIDTLTHLYSNVVRNKLAHNNAIELTDTSPTHIHILHTTNKQWSHKPVCFTSFDHFKCISGSTSTQNLSPYTMIKRNGQNQIDFFSPASLHQTQNNLQIHNTLHAIISSYHVHLDTTPLALCGHYISQGDAYAYQYSQKWLSGFGRIERSKTSRPKTPFLLFKSRATILLSCCNSPQEIVYAM